MRILQLTPGTGNFHCGSCLRDNTLVRALRARGHDVTMVPLYLPLVTDEPAETGNVPIFMSGLSVYLGRKFTLPGWLDRALSSPALLRLAAKMSGLTTAKDLGESAVGMLQGGHGEMEPGEAHHPAFQEEEIGAREHGVHGPRAAHQEPV